jgi:hypothetical protein
MTADQYFYFSAIEKQASKVVYKTFRINRHELNMLVGLSAYLQLLGRHIISAKSFTDFLGLNYSLEKRCWAYIRGLVDKGCLHRLSYRRPSGNCLAISQYGVQVMTCFENAIADIEKQHPIKSSSFKSMALDLDSLPQGYVLRQVGRSS